VPSCTGSKGALGAPVDSAERAQAAPGTGRCAPSGSRTSVRRKRLSARARQGAAQARASRVRTRSGDRNAGRRHRRHRPFARKHRRDRSTQKDSWLNRDYDGRRGLKEEQNFALQFERRHRRAGLFLLMRFGNHPADAAHLTAKRIRNRLAERFVLGVVGHHSSPGEGLQHVPLHSGGETAEDERDGKSKTQRHRKGTTPFFPAKASPHRYSSSNCGSTATGSGGAMHWGPSCRELLA